MKNYSIIETERLILRLTELHDASFVLELLNTPKWKQFIGDRNIHSIADATQYIKEKMLPQSERLGYGNYVVIRKKDDVKIGSCGLYDREGLEGVDIGFAFLPNYEGKGYAYEASKKIMETAFTDFQIDTIAGITAKGNKASQGLLMKLGLTFDKYITLPNEDEEIMLFSIKKNEN
ncbi:Protein N-acetyltransferase, RimJ/RimL family [Tenacibaculum sp. MAR_2009_124]|uniref:GNAT family N-acetyltransferase n=1 Tax=Tenacibaculum sp. MAR_2009_124 TaxID=1250059 RepID=UPI00089856AB|nr:GNAT family N-acetyltransferase [Tenacibaculum sp. MAR_2009_124]SEC18642.1 Protein N-acetyltransferase, RimJ/RimL family [Tenacibaculum sp. MAR_2009_124]